MAIYLDDTTRPELEMILNDYIPKHPTDWVAPLLLKQVLSDYKRLDKIATCSHKKGTYTGIKHCCTKCGSFFEPGMGEEWELDTSLERKLPTGSQTEGDDK